MELEIQSRGQQVRRVLILTLIANVVVAVLKAVIGLITGSLAMVSDAIHSSIDASSNIIGLVSMRIASRPPDESHPYGHRRFETLASMLIGGMLVLTAWEITQGAIDRLGENVTPEISLVNFVVMIATIIVNIAVSTYEARAGQRLNSEILLADSQHTRSDIFVSLTVLASLVAVELGYGWIDAAAALVVVVLIAIAAWRVLTRSINVLVDRAPLEPDSIRDVVAGVPGVEQVVRVRSRGPADDIHIDLDVQVSGPTTADQSEAIAREVRARLRGGFEGLQDIRVYFVPNQEGEPDPARVARAEGDALGLGVHEIIPISDDNGGLKIDMHVEVPPQQTIGEAHALVTQLERRLQEAIPELTRVVTHIEPAHIHERADGDPESAHRLASRALDTANALYPEVDWHDLDIRQETDGGYALSMHSAVPPETRLEQAHRMAEDVETQIRAAIPQLHRVTIHTEPPDGD